MLVFAALVVSETLHSNRPAFSTLFFTFFLAGSGTRSQKAEVQGWKVGVASWGLCQCQVEGGHEGWLSDLSNKLQKTFAWAACVSWRKIYRHLA